jgi:hypothetical protein
LNVIGIACFHSLFDVFSRPLRALADLRRARARIYTKSGCNSGGSRGLGSIAGNPAIMKCQSSMLGSSAEAVSRFKLSLTSFSYGIVFIPVLQNFVDSVRPEHVPDYVVAL